VLTVTAEIDEANAASARVAVAAGFERTIRRSGDEVVWEHRRRAEQPTPRATTPPN
jgi:hypothetical protein